MTLLLHSLVFIGAAANIVGTFSYIRDTLRGKTKPNRISWLMWSVAPMIASAAALSAGVRWAVLPVFMSGFVPFLVLTASFLNPGAYWKLKTFDYVFGACSALTLVLWGITRESSVAIAFAIAADGLAAIPTLVKAWHYPETESWMAYAGSLINALSSFAVLRTWTFAESGFPVYLVIANTLLTLAVFRKKIFRSAPAIKNVSP